MSYYSQQVNQMVMRTKETQKIHCIFKRIASAHWNFYSYRDPNRHAIKSYGHIKWGRVWREVLKRMNKAGITGYELYSGKCCHGDGTVFGVKKYYRK